jgi:cytochrome c oxidase cbb3-type subunit IV
MYKEILQSIDNIQIWPVISFVIFFLFFLILLWWTFTVDRIFISHMSKMPLDDGNSSISPSKTTSL